MSQESAQLPLACREFKYRVGVTNDKPSTELMQLLAQAMDSYHDLPENERLGVVAWFAETYGGD